DISKVDAPLDGILVVNQADGKLLVVSKDITPEAFAAYTTKGQPRHHNLPPRRRTQSPRAYLQCPAQPGQNPGSRRAGR
ncbi:hypothetical protein, partial [Pseudomonas sp. MF6747]|uniref:hypothetical protein n=1 Tax=Pseudomonas sp. MF6747 TaxID=2797527 RepID=UPI0030D964AE